MRRSWAALSLAVLAGLSTAAVAASPALATTAAVQQAAPAVGAGVGLVREVAKVPADVGAVLLLPLGVVECVAAPLPGVCLKSGLGHIGAGLLAPFHLIRDVLTLPHDAAAAIGGICAPVTPGA